MNQRSSSLTTRYSILLPTAQARALSIPIRTGVDPGSRTKALPCDSAAVAPLALVNASVRNVQLRSSGHFACQPSIIVYGCQYTFLATREIAFFGRVFKSWGLTTSSDDRRQWGIK